MLRERYEPEDIFDRVPELAMKLDPILAKLDTLLDDDELFNTVKADLEKRYPSTPCRGRPSTPVEVILRMLVLKHLQNWSYEELERFVADSLVLRQFCRVYLHRVPDDTTLIRWANTIELETLQKLNERAMQLARSLKVTRAKKLRVDTTVVETNIHYPTDSSLLGDGVRVLSRLMKRAQRLLGPKAAGMKRVFRDRTRSAKRLVQRLGRLSRRSRKPGSESEEALQRGYRKLIEIAGASLQQAQQVQGLLDSVAGKGKISERVRAEARRVQVELERFLPLVASVREQARRRVLEGEQVPASEKVVSLFEPHTEVIKRGKVDRPTEFGRKVRLDEVEGGMITGWRVYHGNPADEKGLAESLEQHVERFEKPPKLLAGDRNLSSPENERLARELGVKRICLPQRGRKDEERERLEGEGWFRRGQRFRAGIEGRISVLKRKHGWDRCRNRGERGYERWIGWGVIAQNIGVMARALAVG
ncbi:MAG: ISNCY family transposase [Candidatus Bipolaricaulia bacterium]